MARALRQSAAARTSFAAESAHRSDALARASRALARQIAAAGALALAAVAALAAALAGLVYVVLLPVCGIAWIAGGVARACWSAVSGALHDRRRGALSQD
jgi:hypothetical protein